MKSSLFIGLGLGALYQTLFIFAQAYEQSSGLYGGSLASQASQINDSSATLGQIIGSNAAQFTYPTDFTRNIVPKQLHSHNDYWRKVPFFSALYYGAISVEADIWLYNDTLYVGHEPSALTPQRTLQSLYLEPIMSTLQRQNPVSAFVDGTTRNGVYDTASTQTLYLWLDCKTEGSSTFTAAIDALKPLRDAGYLTTYSQSGGVSMGPITAIGTGNTPLSYFQDSSQDRWYFFDASLSQLGSGMAQENVTSDISFFASAPLLTVIGNVGQNKSDSILLPSQLSTIRSQIASAQAKGIGARYWDTPGWPARVRNGIWRILWEEGVSLVNVDDLQDAAYFDW